MRESQSLMQLLIRIIPARIQIQSDRAREQHGILRDDGEAAAERGERQRGDINPVHGYTTVKRLDDAE